MFNRKKDFDFTFRSPERQVTVPAFNVEMFGERKFLFDTETHIPSQIELVFFQRAVSQWMASSNKAKTWDDTNFQMACQIPYPIQFSMFNVAAEFDRSNPDLCEGVLRIMHADIKVCFESKLGDLENSATSLGHKIPEWFMVESRRKLECICDRISNGKEVFHQLSDKWRPRESYRHLQPGEAIMAVVKFPKAIQAHGEIKILLDGIEWYPE